MNKSKGIILLFIVGILAVISAIALLFIQVGAMYSITSKGYIILTRVKFNLQSAMSETLKFLNKTPNFGIKQSVKMLYLEDVPGYKMPAEFHNFAEFEQYAQNIQALIYGYTLEVEDTSTKVNVNHPANPDFTLKPSAILILNNLARALEPYGFDVLDLGDKVSLYKSIIGRDIINIEELQSEEVVNVLGDTFEKKRKNFEILKNYITTKGLELEVPAIANLNPANYCDIKIEDRANLIEYRPVINLNYAPLEVIYAILHGISGYVWENGESKMLKVDDSKIEKLIEKWKGNRPFVKNFLEFRQYLQKQNIFNAHEIGLIMADLNPYSVFNCSNPDTSVYVDGFGYPHKYSLSSYTTEGIFSQSGIYRVNLESFAYYKGKIIARESVNSILQLEEVFNLATISDFKKSIDGKKSTNVTVFPDAPDFEFLSGMVKLRPVQIKNSEYEIDFKTQSKDMLSSFKGLKTSAIMPSNNELFLHENLIKPNNIYVYFSMKNLSSLSFSFWIKPSWDGEELLKKKKTVARIFDNDIYYFQDGNFVADFGFVQAIKNVIKWKKGTWHYVIGWVEFSNKKYGKDGAGLLYKLLVDGESLMIIKEDVGSLFSILQGLNKIFKIDVDFFSKLFQSLGQTNPSQFIDASEQIMLTATDSITSKSGKLKFTLGSADSTDYVNSSLSNVKIGLKEKMPFVSYYPDNAKVVFNITNNYNECLLNLDNLDVAYYLPDGWDVVVAYYLNDKNINGSVLPFNKGDKLSIDLQFESKLPIRLESPTIFQITARCSLRSPYYVINNSN